MSECTEGELRDLLPELVNGQLDAEKMQAVEAHVASCAECTAELALLRSLKPALMRAPAVNTQRIAAAVHAQTTGAPSRAPVRAGVATRWRVAIAAAVLIGVGTLSYVLGAHRSPVAPEVAVTPTPSPGAADTLNHTAPAPGTAHAPSVVTPRTAPVHAPPQQVAVTPSHVEVPAGVLDNLSDLSDDDVRTLTASLDKLSAVPDVDPAPGIDPLGASLDDLSAGGR
jgi:anti-sigma factor RsiW